jgi:transglutaminase/protease-like cytokinesis protein 3
MIKRIFFACAFIVSSMQITAQDEWSYKKNITAETPGELAALLTEDLDTDAEKVEVFYYWIAHNMTYDFVTHNKNAKKRKKKKKKKKKVSPAKQAKIEKKLLAKIMTTKKCLKPHFSLLFQKLCEAADVESMRVIGWVRTDPKKLRGLGSGHTWNVVTIDGEKKFVDVYYGIGKFDFKNSELIRKYDKTFLFTDKTMFNYTHHPKNEAYQLVDAPLNKKEFRSLPVFGKDAYALKIDNLSQRNSFVTGTKDENIAFAFSFENEAYEDVYLYDTRRKEKVIPEVEITDSICNVSVFSNKLRSGFYKVFFNNKYILSYRIMVKK